MQISPVSLTWQEDAVLSRGSAERTPSGLAAAIEPGKPTVILGLEDPATQHRYEVEAMALKMK
jgi:hypothetical protein